MYMAPEIWESKKNPQFTYDAIPCDIFALGVTLFAMVYQHMPFEKATQDDQLYKKLLDRQ